MIVIPIAAILLGLGLIVSAILDLKRASKSKGKFTVNLIGLFLDVVTDPISSEGIRMMFGGIFVIVGLIFLSM